MSKASELRERVVQRLTDAGLRAHDASEVMSRMQRCRDRIIHGGAREEDVRLLWVPGRIEVLGKHTDYAGGRSLVCALSRGFAVAAAPCSDSLLCAEDLASGEVRSAPLPAASQIKPRDWEIFPAVVAARLQRDAPGFSRGAHLTFHSDLPVNAGASSGSALAISLLLALAHTAPDSDAQRAVWIRSVMADPFRCAAYASAVENGGDFEESAAGSGVGTAGGSQDHAAIMCASANELLQIAFDPLREEGRVKLSSDLTFVIAASGVTAAKTGNAREQYNRLSSMASTLARRWHDAHGRDGTTLGRILSDHADARQQLFDLAHRTGGASAKSGDGADALAGRLEQFYVESFQIIPAATVALRRGDLTSFAAQVAISQENAERLLGNQVPETIALVDLALQNGAIAASAFGAGFGGSVWALVESSAVARFVRRWREKYFAVHPERRGDASFFATYPGPGAQIISPPTSAT